MPDLIILRLYTVTPTTGDNFANYLTGLIITAYDLSDRYPDLMEGDLMSESIILNARHKHRNPTGTKSEVRPQRRRCAAFGGREFCCP